MAYKPVPTTFYDNGVTNIRDVSLLDANFSYVSGKVVAITDFGAVGNGTTDDSAALVAALAYISGKGGGSVFLNGTTFLINANVTVPAGCFIQGAIFLRDPRNFNSDLTTYSSQLLIGATFTLTLEESAGLYGCVIRRNGITYPATQASITAEWNGQAVTIDTGATGASVTSCFIFGFGTAVLSLGATEKIRLENLAIDCVTGLDIESSADTSYINKVHIWPFATIGHVSPYVKRTGPGFKLINGVAFARVSDCFVYGHQIGYSIQGGSGVSLVNCSADNNGADFSDSPIGFSIGTGSLYTKLVACSASAQKTGVQIANDVNDDVEIVGCEFWGIQTTGIKVNQGCAIVTGCFFENMPTAINSTGGTSVTITACHFKDVFTNTLASTTGFVQVGTNQWPTTASATSIANTASYFFASAATLVMPGSTNMLEVSGSAAITAISAHTWPGRIITLVSSSGTWTLAGGVTIHLNTAAGTFSATDLSTITLMWMGSAWVELCRSLNT